MREVKFRGKEVNSGEWVYGWYSKSIQGYYPKEVTQIHTQKNFANGTSQTNYAVIPETVGQYTGLKDKNGVEIFEGDLVVVKYRDYSGEFEEETDVAYNAKTCSFSPMNWEWDCDGCDLSHHNISYEVVGNIHEGEQ